MNREVAATLAKLARHAGAAVLALGWATAQSPFALSTPAFTVDVRPFAALDADGDGDQDLLTSAGLLANDGGGRYSPVPGALPSGNLAMQLARAADLDGDGDQDLVIAGSTVGSSLSLFVLYNGGLGLFGAALALPTSSGAWPTNYGAELVVGDFDGDGRRDVASPVNGLKIHLQTSPGVFVDATSGILAAAALSSTAALMTGGDLDGDGKSELLMNVGQASYLLRHQAGGFVATAVPGGTFGSFRSAAAGDFDGDGRTDFVACRVTGPFGVVDEFVLQPGAAAYAILHGRPNAARLGAIDVGNDGRDDVLRATAGGSVVIDYLTGASLPAPTLYDDVSPVAAGMPAAPLGRRFVVFDADGDGDDDVAGLIDVADYGLAVATTAGGFVEMSDRLPSALGDAQTCVADFDGDGDLDLARTVVLGGASSLELRRNDGRGRFGAPVVGGLTPSAQTARFVFGDFDANGLLDAMQFSFGGSLPVVHRQTAPGVFVATFVGASVVYPVAAAAASDYDGDGDLDVLVIGSVAAPPTGSVPGLLVFVNTAGVFAPATPLGAAFNFYYAAPIQADADGVVDFAVSGINPPPALAGLRHFIVSGATGALLTTLSSVATNVTPPFDFAVGDLNGDGAQDVIAEGAAWLGGTANFAATTSPFSGAAVDFTRRRYLVDVDGDGLTDALSINSAVGQWSARLAGGGFAPASTFTLLPFGTAIEVLADLDRDGDPELVDRRGRIRSNRSAGAAAGRPAFLGRVGSFDVQGPAGAAFDLFAATTVFTQTPVSIPNFGNLWLDPTTAVYVGPGAIGPAGVTEIALAVPNVPALAGFTLWWQAVLPAETRITNAVATPIYAP